MTEQSSKNRRRGAVEHAEAGVAVAVAGAELDARGAGGGGHGRAGVHDVTSRISVTKA